MIQDPSPDNDRSHIKQMFQNIPWQGLLEGFLQTLSRPVFLPYRIRNLTWIS